MSQELIDRFIQAAANGSVSQGKDLIDLGVDVNGKKSGHTALVTAAYNGKTAFVKLLLENGADIGLASDNGQTPRAWAVQQGKTDVVNLLDKWISGDRKKILAGEKNIVVVVTRLASRTLEETFNFATRERISVLCAKPGAPAETMLREDFSDIKNQESLENVFEEYKNLGGSLTKEEVFPDRIFKAKMPRLGGGG